ncbi:hypothetical protein OMF40_20735, partial [Bordetella pertussis]
TAHCWRARAAALESGPARRPLPSPGCLLQEVCMADLFSVLRIAYTLALGAALAAPAVSAELRSRSQEPLGGPPAQVQAQVDKELPKWRSVIQAANP